MKLISLAVALLVAEASAAAYTPTANVTAEYNRLAQNKQPFPTETCADYPGGKCSDPMSFRYQSESFNNWESRYPIGAILGFAAFACAYVFTIIAIFRDIGKRMENYTQDIADAENEMKKLGMDFGPGSDIARELAQRMAG